MTPPGQSAVSYTWDNNGNLTNRGNDTFSWDYEDRMTSTTIGGTTTSFTYRGDGLPNSRTTGGSTTTFTWDINAGLPVVIDDGTQYIYGAGLVSQISGSSTYYYLADGLGSTMKTVDTNGSVVTSYDHGAYGEVKTSSGPGGNEFQFTGQQVDGSTGLQYLRARYYDMETGRFVSRDSLIARPSWVNHPFSYADGRPTLLTDPAGLDSIIDIVPDELHLCGWGPFARFGCRKAKAATKPLIVVGEYLRVVSSGINDWMRSHPEEVELAISAAFGLALGACWASAVSTAGTTGPGCVAIVSGWGTWTTLTALDHWAESDANWVEKSLRLAADITNALPPGKWKAAIIKFLTETFQFSPKPEPVR